MALPDKIGKRLGRKYACVLCALPFLPNKQRVFLLRHMDVPMVKFLCEIALNTIKGNVSVTENHIHKLRKYKRVIRNLSRAEGNWNGKKK